MSSSPTEGRLQALARSYDQALEAMLRDDIERAESLMQACEQELHSLPDPEFDNVLEQGARGRVIESWGRLLDALKQAREATMHDLHQVRVGRRALAGYGGRGDATGTHVSSDF